MVKVYHVGGHIRDKLMGIKSKDIDYAVEAASYAEMVEWIKERGTIYQEIPEYFTVKAHLTGKQPADFVLCRKEGVYSDGRRHDSVEMGTIFDDLARRDFTVNAIAFDEETGEYIDPHYGRSDISILSLRCVGDTFTRLNEDPLRMLRAIRFAITKGFTLSSEIRKCLSFENGVILCDKLRLSVSEDRKREELKKCFKHNTLLTLDYLSYFPKIAKACFHRESSTWLLPTNQS